MAASNGIDVDIFVLSCTTAYLQQMAYVGGHEEDFHYWQSQLLELISTHEGLRRITAYFVS